MLSLIVAMVLLGGTPSPEPLPAEKVLLPEVQSPKVEKAEVAPSLEDIRVTEPDPVAQKKRIEEISRLKKIIKEAEKKGDREKAKEARTALDKLLHPMKYVKNLRVLKRPVPEANIKKVNTPTKKGDLK